MTSLIPSCTEYINSLYPTIKFEFFFCEAKPNVLEVRLLSVDAFIPTGSYSKPTDSHLYFSPSIANPKHVFKAIPSRVASKLRRNCSEDFFLSNRFEEYKKLPYINQRYSVGLVNKELSRAEKGWSTKNFLEPQKLPEVIC